MIEGHYVCSKICSKSSKIRKKVENGICPIKKVDKDAMCKPKELREGAFIIHHMCCTLNQVNMITNYHR